MEIKESICIRSNTPTINRDEGAYQLSPIHTYIHTHIHTCIHTYIHTYTHTYIHTYIHTYNKKFLTIYG